MIRKIEDSPDKEQTNENETTFYDEDESVEKKSEGEKEKEKSLAEIKETAKLGNTKLTNKVYEKCFTSSNQLIKQEHQLNLLNLESTIYKNLKLLEYLQFLIFYDINFTYSLFMNYIILNNLPSRYALSYINETI